MNQLPKNVASLGEEVVVSSANTNDLGCLSIVDSTNFGEWRLKRFEMQSGRYLSSPCGVRIETETHYFRVLVKLFERGLKFCGLQSIGMRNALDVRLRSLDLTFPDLPQGFDGYRILHLTDLHLDALPNLTSAIVKAIKGKSVDLCVMTGDYIADEEGPFEHILDSLEEIICHIDARDGIFGTLGNHDHANMPESFLRLGMHVLVNESVKLRRGKEQIHLTGLDDVNCYYTPKAKVALKSPHDEFSLALVHSPEMADLAAAEGYNLYLCGHTHGGQVCLPGGRVVISRLVRNKPYASGLWHCGKMIGYTSPGAGVSGAPVRFFSRGEATLLTLRREEGQ